MEASATSTEADPGQDINPAKDVMSGLSAGFGSVSAVGALSFPPIFFALPLGFGAAGVVLAIAARGYSGRTPWWAALGIAASVVGIVSGINLYNHFQDASNALQDFGQ